MEGADMKKVERSKKRKGKENSSLFPMSKLGRIHVLSTFFRDGYERVWCEDGCFRPREEEQNRAVDGDEEDHSAAEPSSTTKDQLEEDF